jgi:hypothetical protein
MDNIPFKHHRDAALVLLNNCPNLSHKEAGFLGHVSVASDLSVKQADWLTKLLTKHDLPTLEKGNGNG